MTETEKEKETECSIKYTNKYLIEHSVTNQYRIKYNKCIRESIDILY